MAGPGVTFLGHVSEEEKRERLARAHALVATSVREGWGLVVTEAAASGTVSIGYDVPGLRDSIASIGRHPHARRSSVLGYRPGRVAVVSSRWRRARGRSQPESSRGRRSPQASSRWRVESESPAIQVLDQAGSLASDRAAGNRQALPGESRPRRARRNAASARRHARSELSPILVGAAFSALLAATLIGGIEGWPTRGGRRSQLRAADAAGRAGRWHLAIANRPGHRRSRRSRRGAILVRPWSAARRRRYVACGGHGLARTALRSLVVVGFKSRRPSR